MQRSENPRHAIRNLIFDLGGVVYNIRYENIADALKRHGVDQAERFYSRSFQTHEMDLFEMGLLSPAQFRDYVRQVKTTLTDQQIDDIVNAILIDMPSTHVALLLALRQKYNVFLFSNTNQINYDCFYRHCLNKFGFDVFQACFTRAYFSHQMHIRKPHVEGFHLIIQENELIPSQTVFIDDNRPNLQGARAAGLQCCHLQPGNDMCSLFDDGFNFIGPLED